MCPELKEGKSLIGEEYRGKNFYIKVNAVALADALPERCFVLAASGIIK
jgi:hypothetical protein